MLSFGCRVHLWVFGLREHVWREGKRRGEEEEQPVASRHFIVRRRDLRVLHEMNAFLESLDKYMQAEGQANLQLQMMVLSFYPLLADLSRKHKSYRLQYSAVLQITDNPSKNQPHHSSAKSFLKFGTSISFEREPRSNAGMRVRSWSCV
jgi:hypothetical protein